MVLCIALRKGYKPRNPKACAGADVGGELHSIDRLRESCRADAGPNHAAYRGNRNAALVRGDAMGDFAPALAGEFFAGTARSRSGVGIGRGHSQHSSQTLAGRVQAPGRDGNGCSSPILYIRSFFTDQLALRRLARFTDAASGFAVGDGHDRPLSFFRRGLLHCSRFND